MIFIVSRSFLRSLLTVIFVTLCLKSNSEVTAAVSPVYDCRLHSGTYVCTGAQYRMYCNTGMHNFDYRRSQYQDEYRCLSNNCNCIGNKDTCTCSSSTFSSCYCETYGNSIALTTAVSPVYDCGLYNDTYICTGAQYRMYCNTTVSNFEYWKYINQNQYVYRCYQYQYSYGNYKCYCNGDKSTCTSYLATLCSCVCENYGNSNALTTADSPVYDCGLYNDTYICTGTQYRMYCNTSRHDFYFRRYQYQNQYQCVNNNCNCIGNKDTCTCSSSTLSTCFCQTYGNNITATDAVIPVFDCQLYDGTYICTGAQYRMFCNTRVHDFYYRGYQYQDQYKFQCLSNTNNNCNCLGNKDTCTCYSSSLSSCYCETYGNSIALTTAVSPVYDCGLYNDTYICTGAQYSMYCNTSLHYFSYSKYYYQCRNNNCFCTGNENTCTCSRITLSSCFCESNNNSTTLTTAVSPTYGCGLLNDTYICTGAQYRLYCNTGMHGFSYRRYPYQNQFQFQFQCLNNECNCIGDKDTCTCSGSRFSSCFCTSYKNNITLTTAVSPVSVPDCGLNKDTYNCTGAQYSMYCNTSLHEFYFRRYQYQNQYQCVNNNCNCLGNKDTCTCSSITLSSCFCESYGNSITLTTAVSPTYGCGLFNDTYICTGAQYRLYCNIRIHGFNYWRYPS
ncbi:uncharacterized protein LOC127652039 [Xyrauchen texanus]|uniref:uncharacterized protein LOC127652039 n=1 Tax=Xyrauchen texanus TaxID=154827 RepID=UPI0022421EC4|nr:uncharacterized protein LOC127652039 [Xyrauchen texanus]